MAEKASERQCENNQMKRASAKILQHIERFHEQIILNSNWTNNNTIIPPKEEEKRRTEKYTIQSCTILFQLFYCGMYMPRFYFGHHYYSSWELFYSVLFHQHHHLESSYSPSYCSEYFFGCGWKKSLGNWQSGAQEDQTKRRRKIENEKT